jgi:hypothetical protein
MQILHILEGVNGATERNIGDRSIPSISSLFKRGLLHELNPRLGVDFNQRLLRFTRQ